MYFFSEEEIKDIIEKKSIWLENGLENFPGEFLRLDVIETLIDPLVDKETEKLYLYAWYEDTSSNFTNCFVISFIKEKYIICDHFYEASQVWNYIKKKYEGCDY